MRKILLLGFMLLSLFATAQETFEVNQITYAVRVKAQLRQTSTAVRT